MELELGELEDREDREEGIDTMGYQASEGTLLLMSNAYWRDGSERDDWKNSTYISHILLVVPEPEIAYGNQAPRFTISFQIFT